MIITLEVVHFSNNPLYDMIWWSIIYRSHFVIVENLFLNKESEKSSQSFHFLFFLWLPFIFSLFNFFFFAYIGLLINKDTEFVALNKIINSLLCIYISHSYRSISIIYNFFFLRNRYYKNLKCQVLFKLRKEKKP